MSKQLQQTISTAQQLPLTEQFELFKAMFENLLTQPNAKVELLALIPQILSEAYSPEFSEAITQPSPTVDETMVGFWQPKSLQQHITEQKGRTITNFDDLVMTSWPDEQTVDDFLTFTYQQRQLTQGRDNE